MQTRDEVLDAALRCLIADPTASLGEVAGAIGIGRATLHRHFASREALLHEIGQRALDRWERGQAEADMAGATHSGDAAVIEACLRRMLATFVRDAEDFSYALTDPCMVVMPDLLARMSALQELEVAFFAAAQEAGVLRRDVPAAWLSHTTYGLLIASRDALQAGDVARRGLADLVVSTFLQGVAGR
ncbi:TetR/AcrR family transcriptional regulator [Nocardioides sp. cx-169]|uniref:TetR/AcrR family transcriptional regulator n=1 Tax=Nocardioides sp. cx-169 TaxID=2899080 RepID=UPI001E3AB7DD|nr:TetR/AcrR family transcriptional regulator [Nocardioides sp. cx-169]MCD4534710.1 TetR/AcrR family transcriptional regulator [Nocardioides sp. cx-169]